MTEETPVAKPTHNSRLKQFRSILLIPVVLFVIGACYAYGRLIEVDWLKIERLEVPIHRLPEEFDGFKIIHLSDFHIKEMGKREKKLIPMVNSVGADAIFLTGDYTDRGEHLKIAVNVIEQFESKYGMWGVLGNWDSDIWVTLTLKGHGVRMLRSEVDTIQIDNARLGLIGLRFDDAVPILAMESKRKIIANLKSRLPEDIPLILLAHEPHIIHTAKAENIDLVLSGHTHGGQVRIPFGPAIETPSKMGIWYTKGLYEFGDTLLHINPGIGLEPGPDFIQVRFWCRPEITVITLRPAS